jgi:regulator of sigma E protease
VEVFSLGFPPHILRLQGGETKYCIGVVPLGGYVKMTGENPTEAQTDDPRAFSSHPRWHRFFIAIAGPLMNILLAVGLLTGVYMVRYERPIYLNQPAVIGWVMQGSPAAKAGIEPGDRIVRIAGVQNPTWEDVALKTILSPGQAIDLAVERGDQILDKKVVPEATGPSEVGTPGWVPDRPVQVAQVDEALPAAKAGIRPGDSIVALDGKPVHAIEAVLAFLEKNHDKPVRVTVVRQGANLDFTLTPVLSDVAGTMRYRLGFVATEPLRVDKLPFLAALDKSVEQNKKYSVLILELVEKMVQRKISMRQLEGPIGIARASGEAARQQGWTPLLSLMAAISLNLGIFNLFPFPILDGGVILLLAIEGMRRRDLSLALKERIYQVAFVLLVLFAVLVIYNDLVKAIPGLNRLP